MSASKKRALSVRQVEVLRQCEDLICKVRFLNACGRTRGEIRKDLIEHCGIDRRYQQIRNYLIQPVNNPRFAVPEDPDKK